MLNSIFDGILYAFFRFIRNLMYEIDLFMARAFATAAAILILAVVWGHPAPAQKVAPAAAPAAVSAPVAPVATVLYSPNYRGPDVDGVPQNK